MITQVQNLDNPANFLDLTLQNYMYYTLDVFNMLLNIVSFVDPSLKLGWHLASPDIHGLTFLFYACCIKQSMDISKFANIVFDVWDHHFRDGYFRGVTDSNKATPRLPETNMT